MEPRALTEPKKSVSEPFSNELKIGPVTKYCMEITKIVVRASGRPLFDEYEGEEDTSL